MTLDENLQLLEDWIRRLKIEYDIFFSGAVKKPPYDLRNRVDSLLKRLLEEKKMSYAQRFRYNTLVARYFSYRDLWRRMVSDKELGVTPDPLAKAARTQEHTALSASSGTVGETAHPSGSPTPPHRAEAVNEAPTARSLKIQIADPSKDISKVRELYDFLVAAQGQLGEKKILPFDNFRHLVSAQTAKLKESAGCDCVVFNVSVEDAKVRFTAKAGDSLKRS